MRPTILDQWLDELVMCGQPGPLTRRQALANMLKDGWSEQEAISALSWFKSLDKLEGTA